MLTNGHQPIARRRRCLRKCPLGRVGGVRDAQRDASAHTARQGVDCARFPTANCAIARATGAVA
jgi:hypothetical protein